MGVLTDRTSRVRLLTVAILAWAVAVLFSGAATSYVWLLAARVALGVMTAAAAPTVASLTGDFFPAGERGRIYGLIVGGDILGNGIGFLISGEISSVLLWRFAFWWLIVPSLALAWIVWRLPEPARGGQSQLQPGAQTVHDAGAGVETADGRRKTSRCGARREQIRPRTDLVLHSDPARRPVWWAIR
jgi:MFS family permease